MKEDCSECRVSAFRVGGCAVRKVWLPHGSSLALFYLPSPAMAEPVENLGYKTLGRCTKLIVSYFETNGPQDIADAPRRSEELISGEAYKEVCLLTTYYN